MRYVNPNLETMRTKLFFLALLCSLIATAQLPTDFRSEQIYLNMEKHTYMPGDTINLEGMVTCLAADQSLPFSNYLYIECFDERDSLLVRQKLRCKDEGYFNTRIETDYLWPAGVYYFRAYTQLMRNFSTESFAQQPFLLAKEFPNKEENVYGAKCIIVPSGEKLIAGHLQTLTVLLTDECTFPISAELILMNERNDTLASVKTSDTGMGTLNFIPQLGMKYNLAGQIDGTDYRFPVPEATESVKIQGMLNGKRLSYQIINAGADLNHYHVYTYDRMNGITKPSSVLPQGIILLEKEPRVLSLFLADSTRNILSEATIASKYLTENTLQLPDTLSVGDTIRYTPAGLSINDKVMVRLIPENDLLASHAETELNYLADYTSSLPFPSRMYLGNKMERNRNLYAWLSTASFKRFNLKEALEKGTDIYTHMPEETLTFTGWIEKKTKRPMSNGQLVVYHTETDFVYDVDLDEEGRFRIAVDDFMDGEEFFLQAITPKGKPDFANYHVDDESFPALINNRRFVLPTSRYAETEVTIGNTFDLKYTVGKDNMRNYTLPNVTVKARLKTEENVPTNKFYSTNYKDREEIEERAFGTLYDILQDMPGIIIRKAPIENNSFESGGSADPIASNWNSGRPSKNKKNVGAEWSIHTTRGASVLNREYSLPVIVDLAKYEMNDLDFILYMPAAEIESVELLQAWQTLAYTSGAIHGAILVKTRNHKDRPPLPSKGAMYTPTGLSKQDGTFKHKPLIVNQPGNYRLIVDVITDSDIRSYEHAFQVVE